MRQPGRMRCVAIGMLVLAGSKLAWGQTPGAIDHQIPGGPTASQPASPGMPDAIPGMAPAPLVPLGATHQLNPVNVPSLSAGVLLLLDLEGRFSDAVAAGGGKVFATWFAEDAVTLNNGQPAVRGRGAIAAAANWDPAQYSLSWVAEGAEMGPSSDMGYTWGHYTGRTLVPKGEPVVSSGRYITVWKKLADGTWKVTLDASANLPPPDPAATPAKP